MSSFTWLALVDVATYCVNWQWFSEVFLSPRGNILYRMLSLFNAVPPEGSKVTPIKCWFSALSLTCRDFSWFSESFDIVDCRWWNPSFRSIVLKLLDYLLTQLFTKCRTSSHSCLWTTEPFGDTSFLPNHDTHLFPMNLFTCGMFQTGVFWAFLNFPSHLLPLSQLVWTVLQASHSKWVNICKKT